MKTRLIGAKLEIRLETLEIKQVLSVCVVE
jgi:hypothetical protein